MRHIAKNDKKLFKDLNEAYNSSDVNTVIIRGFDEDDKLLVALNAAISLSEETDPRLRVTALQNANDLVNRVLREYDRNEVKLTATKPVKILGRNFDVKRWDQDVFGFANHEVSIYFPIQSVLYDSEIKRFQKLEEALRHDKSKLKILITTNDYANGELNIDRLSDVIDKTLILDSSGKYPEVYSRILYNLGVDELNYRNGN